MSHQTIIEALKFWAATTPQKTALIHNKSRISYINLNVITDKLAQSLKAIQRREHPVVVSCGLPKNKEFIFTFIATLKAGFIYAPLNTQTNDEIVSAQLDVAKPKIVVVDSVDYHRVRGISAELKNNSIYIVTNSPDNIYKGDFTWEKVKSFAGRIIYSKISKDNICYLNFTSGTTGNPKAAKTSFENIHWNTQSAIKALGLSESDIHLCAFPSHLHPHEIISRPIYLGGTIVLSNPIKIESFISSIIENQVTAIHANPFVLEGLFDAVSRRNIAIPSVRLIESGGSLTSHKQISRFEDMTSARIIPVWGSTETTGIAFCDTAKEQAVSYPKLGNTNPFYETKISCEEPSKTTGSGRSGELLIRGKGVVSGYYGVPPQVKMEKWT
jgi:long-chain acyl-CoA synthetase